MKWRHLKSAGTASALVVTFLLSGLWHGASWTFVVWGLYHGLFLVLERTRFGQFIDSGWRPLRHAYTLLVVAGGWVFFRADSFSQAMEFLKFMAGLGHALPAAQPLARYVDYQVLFAVTAGIIFSAPAWPALKEQLRRIPNVVPAGIRPAVYAFGFVGEIILLMVLLLFSAAWLAGGTYNPFIYYHF